jgi:hypothetical protein
MSDTKRLKNELSPQLVCEDGLRVHRTERKGCAILRVLLEARHPLWRTVPFKFVQKEGKFARKLSARKIRRTPVDETGESVDVRYRRTGGWISH